MHITYQYNRTKRGYWGIVIQVKINSVFNVALMIIPKQLMTMTPIKKAQTINGLTHIDMCIL